MWNIYLLCNRNVSSNMETQWGLIASEHSTHVSKQWKYWNWDTVRKESTTVLSCLGHLLLEKEKDILFFLLSLSGMLQTAKSLQKVEHWHQSAKRTQCSVRRNLSATPSPPQTHTISAPQSGEPWKRKSYRDTSIKFIQRNIFFQILANVLFL